MDIKEYIASGIIESYVLGACSDQEQREVNCLSSIYPEIKEELEKTQLSIEKYAESIAVAPPEALKSKIQAAIKNTQQESVLKIVREEKVEAPKIIRMPARMKLAVAASLLVVVGIGALYLSNLNSMNKLEGQVATLNTEKSELASKFEEVKASLAENSSLNNFVLNESTSEIVLAGTDLSPQSKVRVYWNNKESKAVLISDYLPTPENGKQYQLWAISDGKPIDLGMLDKQNPNSKDLKITPKSVQAFAITLEKDGGNPTPTMDQMYVVGVTNS